MHSDHNSLITELNINIPRTKPDRRVVFRFKEEEDFKKYYKMTSDNAKFTNILDSLAEDNFDAKINQWNKVFKRTLHSCFRKVRINKNDKLLRSNSLYKKRQKAIHEENEEEVERTEEKMAEYEAMKNMEELMFNINELKRSNGNQASIWKLKKKMFPKNKSSLPVAKRNRAGKIITNVEELKEVYLQHYKHRMRNRPILIKNTRSIS